jgi:hypothetical protein
MLPFAPVDGISLRHTRMPARLPRRPIPAMMGSLPGALR